MSSLTPGPRSLRLITQRRVMAFVVAAFLSAAAGCDNSSSPKPPTSKKVTLQLSAEVGAGEAGRSIAVRAYYLRNGGDEEDLAVTPATIPVGATTATGAVSVEVLPCLTDTDRDRINPATGCWVRVALTLRSANGAVISEDETDVLTSMASTSLVVDAFVLPSGALVPAATTVDFAMAESGQIPGATTVAIGSSTAAPTGVLSASIEYLSGNGWLTATIPSGQSAVTLAPATATLAPGRYEATVRVTSASLFTPTSIHVAYVVPQPPKTVTITGAGNGTGLVLVSPNGTTCTTTAGQLSGFCAVPASHGSTVVLTASPAVGNGFTGWSGACQGTADCTLVMDQARAVTATFTILKHDLTVNAAGAGSGVITSSPSGISCTAAGGQTSGTCVAQFDHPTQVTLTATPASATSTFTGWSGACTGTGACVVTMTEARNVTATFGLVSRQLTVTIAGEGTGTVTSSPAGINCTMTANVQTGTCAAGFSHGATVTLAAAPGTDMTFTGWTGADCPGTGTCTVTMDQARQVTATIVPPLYPLNVKQAGNDGGLVTFDPVRPSCRFEVGGSATCTREFPAGTVVTLRGQADPLLGFFWGFTDERCENSATAPTVCVLTMNGPKNVTATFTRPSTIVTVLGAGTGSGTVRSDPWIACTITAGQTSGTCYSNYFGRVAVILTPTAQPGSVFAGWVGCPHVLSSGACQIDSTTNVTVTATFSASPPPGDAVTFESGSILKYD